MKKLIAIAVVLALVVGTAFAVDLGGAVIGSVTLIEANSVEDSPAEAGAGFNRIRIEGSGEAADGAFGGWLRFDPTGGVSVNDIAAGLAWWKPIDQLKITIGNNPDGVWGKQGITGWSFYQTPYDTDVVVAGNTWGWGPWYGAIQGSGSTNLYGQPVIINDVFYGGFGANGLLLEIKPLDILGINLAAPVFAGGTAEDVYKGITAQVDLNLSFGNIALTYNGGAGEDGTFYGYFGLSAIDNLGLDIGIGVPFAEKSPLSVGLGVKFDAGAFGVRLRSVLKLPADDDQSLGVLVDLRPSFAISDTARFTLSAGLGLSAPPKNAPDGAESIVGWHVNPFIEIGEEWGPKFVAGIKLWSAGDLDPDPKGDPILNFALPIALIVSF